MDDGWWGAGEVCGEVLKKHLTIGKADKQRDLGLFGEVLTCCSTEIIFVDTRLLLEIVCDGVADGL